jgi:hypothetical protein
VTWGIQTLAQGGAVEVDLSTAGGVYIESFDVPSSGANVVRTYPAAEGLTLFFAPAAQSPTVGGPEGTTKNLCSLVADYALGFPRLTATPGQRASTVYVFAK